jgi:hypothetical protein
MKPAFFQLPVVGTPSKVAFLGRWQGGRGSSRRCSYGTVSFAVNFRGSSAAARSYGYRPMKTIVIDLLV